MDSVRWQKITSVFQAAREMPLADRPAYLEEVCAADFELRQQVERLLLNDVEENAFLDPERLLSVVAGRDTLVPGTEVLHYRLVAKIGHGGMGEVFKALDTRLNRFVALKFLTAPQAVLEDRQGRFLREARAASALDHPNICTIHGLEEAPGGRRFIVMACYEGETLKERIQKGPVPQPETVSLGVQIGEGLSQAHAAGIIHRDIKPANVIVTRDGLVKILDFGIAKLAAEEQVTRPGASFGTIEYMSPEQALGERVDHRTDIWAVGVLLYEMLSGRLPFRGDDARATFAAILNREPDPLLVQFNISAALEAAIKKALSKDPGARYQRMSDLVSVLKHLQETEMPAGTEPKDPRFARFPPLLFCRLSRWARAASRTILPTASPTNSSTRLPASTVCAWSPERPSFNSRDRLSMFASWPAVCKSTLSWRAACANLPGECASPCNW